MRTVRIAPTFESWQRRARHLLAAGVAPEDVEWIEQPVGAGDPDEGEPIAAGRFLVPRRFVELARLAAAHPDPGRWAMLYRVLWRLTREQRARAGDAGDPDLARLERLADEVRSGRLTRTDAPSARPFVPAGEDLETLRRAAAACTGCDLSQRATQTVFGEGPGDARVMLVGEQPGDQEDLQGRPFVGPAGAVLDRALAEAGLDRRRVYVTNAVKHFKWVARGKRRLHEKPSFADIQACRPWLEAEIAALKPAVIVCLGATAAQTLFGPAFRVLKHRGRVITSPWAPRVLVTIHPSAVLRAPDPAAEEATYRMLVEDLRQVAALISEL